MRKVAYRVLVYLLMLISTATAILWVRSYFIADLFERSYTVEDVSQTVYGIRSESGRLALEGSTDLITVEERAFGVRLHDYDNWNWSTYELNGNYADAGWFGIPIGYEWNYSVQTMFTDGPGEDYSSWCWYLLTPHWLIWSVTTLPVAIVTWRWRRRAQREMRRKMRQCTECGYDLRASPGRCPECGAPAEAIVEPSQA